MILPARKWAALAAVVAGTTPPRARRADAGRLITLLRRVLAWFG